MLNDLTDEPSIKTKADVLDLIISFLMEHEKHMDQTLQRIERIADILLRNARHREPIPAPNQQGGIQPHAFTLNITNPDNFKKLRSLKIEWELKRGDADEEDSDAEVTISGLERAIGKDRTSP